MSIKKVTGKKIPPLYIHPDTQAKIKKLMDESGKDFMEIFDKAINLVSEAYEKDKSLFDRLPSILDLNYEEACGTLTPKEIAEKARDNEYLSEYFTQIMKILERPINSVEMAGYLSLIEFYRFPANVVCLLTAWCHENKKDRIAYVEKMAQDWYNRNIMTYQQAEEEIKKLREKDSLKERYFHIFKTLDPDFNKQTVSAKEASILKKWDNDNIPIDVISNAAKTCLRIRGRIDIAYTNGIVKNRIKQIITGE